MVKKNVKSEEVSKETKKVTEKVETKEVSKNKQTVYAFKPTGIMQHLNIAGNDGEALIEVKANESIALKDEQIASSKDLQLLIESGELEKVTN